MFIQVTKPSIYELKGTVSKGDIVIANTTDHDLSEGRVYVALSDQGENTFHDCFFVKNDAGVVVDYSNEYFARYDGERVCAK